MVSGYATICSRQSPQSYVKRSPSTLSCMACTRPPRTRAVAMSPKRVLLRVRTTHPTIRVDRIGLVAEKATATVEKGAVTVDHRKAPSLPTEPSLHRLLVAMDSSRGPAVVTAHQNRHAGTKRRRLLLTCLKFGRYHVKKTQAFSRPVDAAQHGQPDIPRRSRVSHIPLA